MDLHPMFVHFPVVLMTVYGASELLRFKKLRSTVWWFYIQALTAIGGTVMGWITFQTGRMAGEAAGNTQLIQMHGLWANIAAVCITVAGVLYTIMWLNRMPSVTTKLSNNHAWNMLTKIQTMLAHPALMMLLGLATITSVTITGSLGGAIVYGPEIDPAVSFVYHLFF